MCCKPQSARKCVSNLGSRGVRTPTLLLDECKVKMFLLCLPNRLRKVKAVDCLQWFGETVALPMQAIPTNASYGGWIQVVPTAEGPEIRTSQHRVLLCYGWCKSLGKRDPEVL